MIAKLLPEIKPGSVIAVNADGVPRDMLKAFLETTVDEIRKTGITPVFVVPLLDGMSIDVLDEEMMRKAGWVRAEAGQLAD